MSTTNRQPNIGLLTQASLPLADGLPAAVALHRTVYPEYGLRQSRSRIASGRSSHPKSWLTDLFQRFPLSRLIWEILLQTFFLSCLKHPDPLHSIAYLYRFRIPSFPDQSHILGLSPAPGLQNRPNHLAIRRGAHHFRHLRLLTSTPLVQVNRFPSPKGSLARSYARHDLELEWSSNLPLACFVANETLGTPLRTMPRKHDLQRLYRKGSNEANAPVQYLESVIRDAGQKLMNLYGYSPEEIEQFLFKTVSSVSLSPFSQPNKSNEHSR